MALTQQRFTICPLQLSPAGQEELPNVLRQSIDHESDCAPQSVDRSRTPSPGLWNAIGLTLNSFTSTECRDYFFAAGYVALGACLNSRCSIVSESDSTLGDEQVFSPLAY